MWLRVLSPSCRPPAGAHYTKSKRNPIPLFPLSPHPCRPRVMTWMGVKKVDNHAPPVSTFPKAPLSFKRIHDMSSPSKVFRLSLD
ncbi:hypothetical protein JHK86_017906 [Glycine max]|nr:hypothetical protein JHK86_017906 [Glycine max]